MTTEATGKPKPKVTAVGCLITLVVLGLCTVGGFVVFSNRGGSAPAEPTADEAVAQCEKSVKDRLKAPATASFGVESVSKSNRTFIVANTVDAENSLGAKVRMNYACTVTAQSDGTWHLDSLAGLDQ